MLELRLTITQSKVKQDVWRLCGVGISNPTTPPAIFVACMAINLCESQFSQADSAQAHPESLGGDRFTLRHEQEQLLDVLTQTERLHGWPTVSIQETLREVWGWRNAGGLTE